MGPVPLASTSRRGRCRREGGGPVLVEGVSVSVGAPQSCNGGSAGRRTLGDEKP